MNLIGSLALARQLLRSASLGCPGDVDLAAAHEQVAELAGGLASVALLGAHLSHDDSGDGAEVVDVRVVVAAVGAALLANPDLKARAAGVVVVEGAGDDAPVNGGADGFFIHEAAHGPKRATVKLKAKREGRAKV